jgi:signal transduction histidine kinase
MDNTIESTATAPLAHDIRNLIQAIALHSDILLDRCRNCAEVYEDITAINTMSNQATALACRLMSRKSQGEPALTQHPDALVCMQIAGLRPYLKNIKVTADLNARETTRVGVHPDDFSRVITNLLRNAGDALQESQAGQPWITVATATKDAQYIMIVKDTGKGISEEALGSVFNPFFTTKEEGTGLGLATVKSIVEKAGGQVSVESTPGNGARFTVAFPMLEQMEGR